MNRSDLWRAARQRGMPDRALLLAVDTGSQRLQLLDHGTAGTTFPVSTSARGLNNQEGSLGTPSGFHLVAERYGDGEPPGRIFRNRRACGLYDPAHDHADDDLILGRILRLSGLEPGLNQGPGRCSYERTIYLHGTKDTHRVGQPVSGGCIRLRPEHMVHLFELTRNRTTWCWIG